MTVDRQRAPVLGRSDGGFRGGDRPQSRGPRRDLSGSGERGYDRGPGGNRG